MIYGGRAVGDTWDALGCGLGFNDLKIETAEKKSWA